MELTSQRLDLWSSRILCWLFHSLVACVAVRLVFIALLPLFRNEWWSINVWHAVWMLGAFAVGMAFRRGGLWLLWLFPVMMTAGSTALLPYFLRSHELLASAYLGWLVVSVGSRKLNDSPNLADGVVQVLGIVTFTGMVAALATPSFENSLVAFGSLAIPPVQSEFYALTFGQVALIAMGFFHMVRSTIGNAGLVRVPQAIWLQILVVFAVSVVSVLWDWRQSGKPPVLPLAWPFGGIHGSGGVAILFFGFAAGFLAFRKSGEPGRLVMVAGAILSAVLVAPTGSKGAYLGGVVVVIAVMISLAMAGEYRLLLYFGIGGVAAGLFLSLLANRLPGTELSERIGFFAKVHSWGAQKSNEERLQIFQRAIDVAGANFLSGAGLGKFAYVMEYYGSPDFEGTKDERLYENPKLVDPPYQGSAPAPYNYFMSHNSLLEVASGCGVLVAIVAAGCLLAWLLVVGQVQNRVSGGAMMAIIAWLPMNLVDSRIMSPTDGILSWQFLAIGCATVAGSSNVIAVWGQRLGCKCLLAGAIVLSALTLFGPSVERVSAEHRIYGTHQWMRAVPDGFYAVAREARFSSTNLETGGRLVMRLPEARRKTSKVRVRQDGREVSFVEILPGSEVVVNLAPTVGTSWIEIETDRWARRGFGGSLFGIEPEALLVRRDFGESTSVQPSP